MEEEDGVVFKPVPVICDEDPHFHILPGRRASRKKRSAARNPYISSSTTKDKLKQPKDEFPHIQDTGPDMATVSEEISKPVSYETEKLPPNDVKFYTFKLKDNSTMFPVDEDYMAFMLQDIQGTALINNYHIITRQPTKTEEGTCWTFACTCNPAKAEMVHSLGVSMSTTVMKDLAMLHSECLHIKAAKQLLLEFDSNESITAEREFEKHIGKTTEEEHCYLATTQMKISIFGNPVDDQVLVVQTSSGQALCGKHYSLVRVVYNQQTPRLQCFNKGCSKNTFSCEHVRAVKSSSDEVTMHVKGLLDSEIKHRKKYTPKAVSVKKISFTVMPEEMKENRELGKFCDLSPDECGTCGSCGSFWTATIGPNDIAYESTFVFTSTSILPVKVFYRKCSNPACSALKEYDGVQDQVLNMGQYLVTHRVLRDFLHQYVTEGTPLISFYKEWYWRQMECGYHDFQDKLSFYSHSSRVFINSQKTRKILQRYSSTETIQKLEIAEFNTLKEQLQTCQPSLIPLLEEFEDMAFTHQSPIEYRHILQILSKNYPVCGFLRYDERLFNMLSRIAEGHSFKDSVYDIQFLQETVPVVLKLLNGLNGVSRGLKVLLKELILVAKRPYENKNNIEEPVQSTTFNHLGFFPTMDIKRNRGNYVLDKKIVNQDGQCSKKGTSHPSLTPGLFIISCVHGVCCGFQVMDDVESVNVPFTIMKTRFRKAPEVIVYDNACKLHIYCLNRDPGFFRESWFLVDRFHWKNHSGCHSGYNMSEYPHLDSVNTQVAEQRNSTLRKLKSSISYMNLDHFFLHCTLYIWFRNMLSLANHHPKLQLTDMPTFIHLARVYTKGSKNKE